MASWSSQEKHTAKFQVCSQPPGEWQTREMEAAAPLAACLGCCLPCVPCLGGGEVRVRGSVDRDCIEASQTSRACAYVQVRSALLKVCWCGFWQPAQCAIPAQWM